MENFKDNYCRMTTKTPRPELEKLVHPLDRAPKRQRARRRKKQSR